MIAKQTNAWTSQHGSEAEPTYDAAAISRRIVAIASANSQFESFFATFDFPRREILYEDFLKDQDGVVSATTEWLGLGPSTVNTDCVQLERQQSSVNQEWRERFLAEQMKYFSS